MYLLEITSIIVKKSPGTGLPSISVKFPEGVFERLPRWHNKSKEGTFIGVTIRTAEIIGERKLKSAWLDIFPKTNPGIQSRVTTAITLQSPFLLRRRRRKVKFTG